MNPLRYAVYLAPPPESALWRFGSAVVGRDAASGEALLGFAPDGFDAAAWRDLTTEPRRYGFHATIKAPFRLAEDASLSDLSAALAELAHAERPFAAGRLAVSTLALGEAGRLRRADAAGALAGDRAARGAGRARPRRVPRAAERRRTRAARPRATHRAPARDLRTLGIPLCARRVSPAFHPDQRRRRFRRGLPRRSRANSPRASPTRTLVVDALALFVQKPDGDFVIDQRFPLGG